MKLLSRKRKDFLGKLLSKCTLLESDSVFASGNEEEFKKVYGVGFQEADESVKALVQFLKKRREEPSKVG